MKTSSILQILVLFGLCQIALAETCYPVMPEKSSIQGTMTRETFAGAPNYKSIEDGDKQESYFFLNLSSPICLAVEEDQMVNKSVPSASKIQLIFSGNPSEMYEKMRPYLNSEIKCSGYLFSQHLPRHHTPVLLMTQECDPVSARSP